MLLIVSKNGVYTYVMIRKTRTKRLLYIIVNWVASNFVAYSLSPIYLDLLLLIIVLGKSTHATALIIYLFHYLFSFSSKITKRKVTEQSKNKCHVCNTAINLERVSDFVTCGSCNHSPICRNLHCAIWSDKLKLWNCKLCRSFLNGSNTACDWLIAQLNEKLLQGKAVDGASQIVWDQSNANGEI